MASSIRYIDDKDGNHVFPVTHERAVRDSDGVTLETKLGQKQDVIELITSDGNDGLDAAMSDTSTNAVQNNVIKAYIDNHSMGLDDTVSNSSSAGVKSSGIYQFVQDAIEAALQSLGNTTYTVTASLSGVTLTNAAVAVVSGSAYANTVIVPDGSRITSATVTMGGTDITSTAYNSGSISIAAVTGNIVITVSASVNTTTYRLLGGSCYVDTSMVYHYDNAWQTATYYGVKKGDVISFTAYAGNSVAVMSAVRDGAPATLLKTGISGSTNTYTYTATEDLNIAFSFRKADGYILSVNGASVSLLTYGYINTSLRMVTSSDMTWVTTPAMSIPSNSTIAATCFAGTVVSLMTQVSSSVYTAMLVQGGGTKTEYTYTTLSDIDVVLSFRQNYNNTSDTVVVLAITNND